MRLAAWTPPIAEAATFYPPWALGYFGEAGLDFRWLAGAGSPGALALLERGEAEAAFVSGLGFLQAAARGAPILAVYSLFPRSCFAVFGPRAGGIRQPRDLAGRRIGVRSAESSGAAWLRLLLRLDGLTGDEAEAIVVGEAGVHRLLDGSIDALVGSDAILYDARRAGLRDPFVFWLDRRLPLPSDVIALRADAPPEPRRRLAAFLAAYRRGLRFAASQPGRAAECIPGLAIDGQDARRNRAMLALRLALSAPRSGRRLGEFDRAELEAAVALLRRHGLLERSIEIERFFSPVPLDR